MLKLNPMISKCYFLLCGIFYFDCMMDFSPETAVYLQSDIEKEGIISSVRNIHR